MSKNKARYHKRKTLFNIADALVKDQACRDLLMALLAPIKGSNNGVLTPEQVLQCNAVRTALIHTLKEGSSVNGFMPDKAQNEFSKTWRG